MQENTTSRADSGWVKVISKYRTPSLWRSWWQIANTLLPYIGCWILMILSLDISWWITLALSIPAAGLLVRLFIIFHDCGHGAFFQSKKLADTVGYILGVLTFTPYYHWHQSHLVHHRTAGNLDKRGKGDVWTLTVDEYLSNTKAGRLKYRIFRNPFIMFLIGAPLMFLVSNRFTRSDFSRRERLSVYLNNAGILVAGGLMTYFFGWKAYLLIQLPVMYFAAIAGVYMFYVQHQYEDAHWVRNEAWDFKEAALKGSSFFRLPKVLQWFTGNIGFHHIHHLSFSIPNYYLERCHNESPMFSSTKPITLFQSFKTLRLRLWDEKSGRMIPFSGLKLP